MRMSDWSSDVCSSDLIDLRLVETEEEEQAVLHEADPYLVQDDRLPLREIVEDEILLALPMLPRCESCENVVQASPQPKAEDETVRREVNRSEEHTSELQSLMRSSYAVFCLKKKRQDRNMQ